MLITQYILMLIIAVNTAIGITIYVANPKRSQNRLLLHFCNTLTIWMCFVLGIIYSKSAQAAEMLIRLASITATSVPVVLALMLNSITSPNLGIIDLARTAKAYILAAVVTIVLCSTNFFLIGASLPSPDSLASSVVEAKYGKGFLLFSAYFLITILSILYSSVKKMRRSQGIAKTELQYLLLGTGLMLLVSFTLSLVIPLIFKTTQVQQFGPVSVIVMNTVLAYGIATKRILDVGTIIRKIVAYILLTAYLIIVYTAVWAFSRYLVFPFALSRSFLAQLTAAIAVAFSMAPVHGRFQRVADKLVSSKAMDIPATMRKAGAVFQNVTTEDALLKQFSSLLIDALHADEVRILLTRDTAFYQAYPKTTSPLPSTLIDKSVIAELIRNTKNCVSIDSLVRTRQTKRNQLAVAELSDINASVAVGIFAKTNLQGMALFGGRLGGKIYDKTEQDTLQILCNQFAVALENAQLYTEVQDSKIRNEIMLDQLVSGVIVANPQRKIELFNHEAQRITGIEEEAAIGTDIVDLPKSIRVALETTLKNQTGERNVEARLFEQDETRNSLNIRMGTTYLLGYDKKPMGALLVFTDMTELKSLEEQVRRTDQLSSVGTLAAGMAHEIKNPLVTIKTFTQLLPHRYGDEDFRVDFSSLVAHEVERIDGIVNELLTFSKPTKPHLIPMNMHDVVEQTLKLTHEQMAQRKITTQNNREAKIDKILGDAKLLTQAIINLAMNAAEAIGQDGTITFVTSNCTYRFANGAGSDNSSIKACIRIQISDSGQGIAPEHIKQIFDPFFTSKSEGTGMGLSVALGIIQEHHGVVEVESEVNTGSTFYVYIPIIEEDAA